ncbi:unnamed protein product [Boreogadus saida]
MSAAGVPNELSNIGLHLQAGHMWLASAVLTNPPPLALFFCGTLQADPQRGDPPLLLGVPSPENCEDPPGATDADAGLVPRGSDATAALQPLSNSGGSVFSQTLHVVHVCLLPGRPTYWLGKDTLRVSAKLFAENRRRLCQGLGAAGAPPGAVVLLQGGEQKQRYCTDTDDVFRQVGQSEASRLAPIASTSSALLPQRGSIPWSTSKRNMLLIFEVNNTILHPVIVECRVTETDMELEIMRYTHTGSPFHFPSHHWAPGEPVEGSVVFVEHNQEVPAQHGGLLGFLCSAESHRELFDVLYRG